MILKSTEAIIQTSQGVPLPGAPYFIFEKVTFSAVVKSVVAVVLVLSCNKASDVGDMIEVALSGKANFEKKQDVNMSIL